MAGTVHGIVNKMWPRLSSGDHSNSLQVFSCVATFFDHLCTVGGGSYMTRIASNYAGGSGYDLRGLGNPNQLGDGSIANRYPLGVWKMNTSALRPGGGSALGEVYIALIDFEASLNEGRDLGQSVGGRTTSGSYQGYPCIQIAFREDGGNPWNGTDETGSDPYDNLGLDRIRNPIWIDGGSTLHVVCPARNNPGGDFNTNKNSWACLAGAQDYYHMNITDSYFHGFADADTFVFFLTSHYGMEASNDPLWYASYGFGVGTLQPNCGTDAYTCYSWVDGADSGNPQFNRGSEYGPFSSTSATQRDGGLKPPRTTIGPAYYSVFQTGLDQVRSPNDYSVGGVVREEQGIELYNTTAWLGYAHEPSGDDFWRIIYGVPNESYDPTNKRAAFGRPALLTEKMTVPWPDSIGEAPGATRTYDGVTF